MHRKGRSIVWAAAICLSLPMAVQAQYGTPRRVATDSLLVRDIAQFDSTARFLDVGVTPFTVVSSTLVSNLNSDLLDGQTDTYYLDSDNFTGTEWTDLTDSGETGLHIHDDRYYTESEVDTYLGAKEDTISVGTTNDYWRGDKSWQTLNTSVVPESGNLYFTDERVDDRVDALIQDVAGKLTWTYDDGGGTLTPVITYDSQYFSGTNWTDLTDTGDTVLHSHKLNDLSNPDGNKTFNMTTRQLEFLFTNPSGNPVEFTASGAYTGALVHIHQHTGNPGSTYLLELESEDTDVEHITSTFPTSTGETLCLYVNGDTEERFILRASGKQEWGPGGSAPQDLEIYRSGIATLTIGDSLTVVDLIATTTMTASGVVTASGGNSGEWNTAYGWGDHGSGGYAADADVLKKDGSVALTANWDAGGYEIRALTFESDQATGTAPFTVASVTEVANLRAATASQWATTRTIDMSGDVSSDAVNIDGSGNVTITSTAVANDSHTHDTQYYTEAEADALLQAQDTLVEMGDVSLADPGADQIVFWDDSDSQFEFLVANTGLAVSVNNLNVTADYSVITANDGATDVTAAELEELSDGTVSTLHDHDVTGLDSWPTIDYSYVSGNDGATGVTAAELEELSDGSDTSLHNHGSLYYTETEIDNWVGTTNITTLGTIGTGVWEGTAVADGYIASSGNWNTAFGWGDHASGSYADSTDLDDHLGDTANPHSVTKAQVGLTDVEDTALSTWAGTENITTLGTIATGTWEATVIDETYLDANLVNQTEGDARYLMLDASNDPVTGQVNIELALAQVTPLLLLEGTGSDRYMIGQQIFSPDIEAGDEIMLAIGKDRSSRDTGQIYFRYAGEDSTGNLIAIGLHSVDNALVVNGAGNVGVNDATPTYKLDVNGTLRVVGASTVATLTSSGTLQAEHLYSTDDAQIDDALNVGGTGTFGDEVYIYYPGATRALYLRDGTDPGTTVYMLYHYYNGAHRRWTTGSAGGATSTFNIAPTADLTGPVFTLSTAGAITNIASATASGTVQAEHLYSTDDLVVDGLATIGETLVVTGQIKSNADNAFKTDHALAYDALVMFGGGSDHWFVRMTSAHAFNLGFDDGTRAYIFTIDKAAPSNSLGINSTGYATFGSTVQAEHLYSTDDAVIDDDLLVSGDITMAYRLIHSGDTDTWFQFTPDVITMQGGGGSDFTISGNSMGWGSDATAAVGFEIGSRTTAISTFIDFHSSGNDNDYDARILASGGTTVGTGTLTVTAATLNVTGSLDIDTDLNVDGTFVTAAMTLSGTLQAEHVYSTDDAQIDDHLTVGGEIFQGDGDAHQFGDSADMAIYHSGVDGYITNATGDVIFTSTDVEMQSDLEVDGQLGFNGAVSGNWITNVVSNEDQPLMRWENVAGAGNEDAMMSIGTHYRTQNTNPTEDGVGLQKYYYIENDADEDVEAGSYYIRLLDVSDGTEDSQWSWNTIFAGAANLAMTLNFDGGLSIDAEAGGAAGHVLIFDDYDDASEIRNFAYRLNEDDWYAANAQRYVDMGILSEKEGGYMMSIPAVLQLHAGGIYQTADRVTELEYQVSQLRLELQELQSQIRN